MVQREQKNHVIDCYFCLTNVLGHSHKAKKNIQYSDLAFAICPVQHSVHLPIPMPLVSLSILDEGYLTSSESSDADFEPCISKVYHI